MISNTLTIAKIFMKYAISNPSAYFVGVVFFPVSLLVPLVMLGSTEIRTDIFVGSIICTTTIMTITDISDIVSHDKYGNSVSLFTTRPIKTFEYILGVGLSTLVYNIFGLLVILLIGATFLGFQFTIIQTMQIMLLVITGWLISCSIGFLFGLRGPKDPRMNTGIASIVAYMLTFLAPAYYPISALPPLLQNISFVFYTTSLSLVGKSIIRNDDIPTVGTAILFIYLTVSLVLLFKIMQWKTSE
jgi:ABC-type multidrug transport system permease subunit